MTVLLNFGTPAPIKKDTFLKKIVKIEVLDPLAMGDQ